MNIFCFYQFFIKKLFQPFFCILNFYLLSILPFYCPNSYSQSAVGGLSAEQIYEKVSNTVVVVQAYDFNNKLATQGSGVVINDKGYVVTNYHVLSGNVRLEILHGKKIVPYVDIIGIDVEKDILILKIRAKKFPPIKLGNSNSLKIGQRVYAIGSPMGFENTISEGIISGLRSYEELRRDFIQITASISPGSSGGAVVNDKGELIGISTLTVKEGQNINFAIPIDDVLAVDISSYSKNDTYKNFELYKYGKDAYDKGDYHKALEYFSRFIEYFPNSAVAYYNRGIAKFGLTDYQGAIQDYDKAIELNLMFAEAYNNRGHAKDNIKDHMGSIEDYNKAIEIDPKFAVAYLNRGAAKGDLEDTRGAIQDFSTAIELDPNYAAAYYNRGLVKIHLTDYTEAIQDFNQVIMINPNYAGVYYDRGTAKGYLEDYRGAIQDYNKAIEFNPTDSKAYNNRAASKFLLGDKAGACMDWSKAGELGNAKAYDLIKKFCK
jgi:S1-C subfamily serine protease